MDFCPYPKFIPKFVAEKVSITHVAAGAHHVLAINQRGEIYSWGAGKSGKLG